MSSPGTGSPISPEEANDLLHRLITESIKVRVIFVSPLRVRVMVSGFVKELEDGVIAVRESDTSTSGIDFPCSATRLPRYADARVLTGLVEVPGEKTLSALCFVLADGSWLGLFEIGADE